MILAVAGVSVLCVYLMQLPGDVHSFVTLRSLGMTRGQLWQLCLTETGLLLLPALVLGVPLGAGLTWVGLRLLAYTDSVPVKVALPWGQLGLLVVLWLAVTALARTLLFWVAVRTPLTGGFQLRQGAARRVRWLRNGLIGVLLCVFGMVTVMPLLESQTPLLVRENLTNQSHYTGVKAVRYGPEDPHWLRRADHAPTVRGAVPHPGHCFRPCPPAKGRGPLLCGDAPAHRQPAGGGRPVGFFAAGGGCRRL